MNDRDSLLRKARKSKHKNDWTAYKRLRNFCINSVKRSKAKFHKNLVDENTLNPRKFWSVIKSIFPTKGIKSKDFTKNSNRKSRVAIFSTYYKNAITSLKLASIPLMNFTWRLLNHCKLRTCQTFTIKYNYTENIH